MAIFAPDERLPSSATLVFVKKEVMFLVNVIMTIRTEKAKWHKIELYSSLAENSQVFEYQNFTFEPWQFKRNPHIKLCQVENRSDWTKLNLSPAKWITTAKKYWLSNSVLYTLSKWGESYNVQWPCYVFRKTAKVKTSYISSLPS